MPRKCGNYFGKGGLPGSVRELFLIMNLVDPSLSPRHVFC